MSRLYLHQQASKWAARPDDPAQPGPKRFFLGPGGPHQSRPTGQAGLTFCWAARPELYFLFLSKFLKFRKK